MGTRGYRGLILHGGIGCPFKLTPRKVLVANVEDMSQSERL